VSLIDLHIAQKLKSRRVKLRVTRKAIADLLGISYQQIHKYEAGKNRIPASRLYQLSQILYVPIGYFFEGLNGFTDGKDKTDVDHEVTKLLKAYYKVPQVSVRKTIVSLLEVIGQTPQG